jgi:uncharacterized membrane protein YphA (DoxX/SURF4 family)
VKLSVKTKGETWGSIVSGLIKQYGIRGLYIGITPKLFKSAAQKFIYFYLSEALMQIRLRLSPLPVGALQELGLSLLADYGCVPIVVPLEAITTQCQTAGDDAGMLRTSGRMYRESGLGGFFDGWSAYMAGSFQPAIQFTLYNQVRRYLLLSAGVSGELGGAAAFLLGGFSRAVSEMLTYPTLVIQYIQQSADHEDKHKSVLGVAGGIWKREGFRGLYNGIVPQLGQAVLGAAIMMLAKEKVTNATKLLVLGRLGA